MTTRVPLPSPLAGDTESQGVVCPSATHALVLVFHVVVDVTATVKLLAFHDGASTPVIDRSRDVVVPG